MPTYVYKFLDTGETIEVQQSFNDPTLTEAEHPVTGDTMPVKKVFLPVGVTFKGDGFYKTDSRSGATKGSSSSSSASGPADAATSSSADSSSSGASKSDAPTAPSTSSTKSESTSGSA
jgi:predicted nucleic acid-binding Zn ribbon protein